ncbi:baeRF7 domain-containing protein [Mastigocladopsis repens]|uniref:baeRF7 domain-containing protein n=1 Tax=Mastigocladopsis repens TaxID=221287 RepID=UPI0002ED8267|nr:hypothetical protein [Mastigocladopsis repens]
MKILSIYQLKTLIEKQDGVCVSIYMRTPRLGTETQQDPTRFKNLLREAEEQLIKSGLRGQDARELLERAKELDEYKFWQHQSDGLAIFISNNLFSYYCLPINFQELVVVTDRFHLKPLLPLLTGDGQFYILALSQNQVRLFQGTRYSVSEIELENVPQSIAEALKYDDAEKQLQFHTGTSQAGGDARAAMFHGQGADNDEQKDNIVRYFRQVNAGLQELLKNQQALLVLAGVEYLFPIYKEANTYHYLMDEGVTGNPDELKAQELHRCAWEIVQPYFQEAQEAAADRYQALAGTGQTSNNIKEIVPMAYYQLVDTLFVAVGVQRWGNFTPDDNLVELHWKQEIQKEDLMDFAAIHTLLNGGTVYAVEPELVPGNAPLAAVFRF